MYRISEEIRQREIRLPVHLCTIRNFIDRTVAVTREVIIGSSQNWCRWKCLEETGLFGIFSSRHFHRHQFCEDPTITSRVKATVRSIKLRTVPANTQRGR
ncbi:hypothetical protein AVEN_259350-1 [Araneus ventricosus]|uniref:Uncharacterized protein n=1 Tax=Araneus ventricosus TaxID=182803 RepID=A0A4Y2DRG9_ARAVE|nr:hypothetical protein AVEN_259350-1 [Araneus ventricosus]